MEIIAFNQSINGLSICCWALLFLGHAALSCVHCSGDVLSHRLFYYCCRSYMHFVLTASRTGDQTIQYNSIFYGADYHGFSKIGKELNYIPCDPLSTTMQLNMHWWYMINNEELSLYYIWMVHHFSSVIEIWFRIKIDSLTK